MALSRSSPARPRSPRGQPDRTPPRVRRRLRAVLRRARLPLAAALLGLAAAVTVAALSPPPPPTAPLLVAASALAAGTTLTEADVDIVFVAPHLIPDDALTQVSGAMGQVLGVTVTPGTFLSGPVLLDPDRNMAGPPGTVVTAVRLAEPGLVRLLSPGMRLDLLAPTGEATGSDGAAAAAAYLARKALVLPTPTAGAAEAPSGGLLALDSDASGTTSNLVLVAVTPEEAALLANVSGWGTVSGVVVQ